MKRLPLLFATALLLAPATANDQVRDVQGALKAQGFYYGDVTGTESAETGAAIRRFQIRSGISVTGKLNAETVAALGLGGKKTVTVASQPAPAPPTEPARQPAPAAQKQVNPAPPAQPPALARNEKVLPVRKDGDLISGNEAKNAGQDPVRRPKPADGSVVEPPTPIPTPVSTPFSTMFRGTPYADAPRAVQSDIVRRAQAWMAVRRFYRGALDGVAGPATSEAIFALQEEADLRRTGRLDPETLAEMNLLPQTARGNPLLKPFYNPNRRRDPSVSWDYWVR
jgi:peptidoglycan hydrolase-like protein with peptidoglycan-binding domain